MLTGMEKMLAMFISNLPQDIKDKIEVSAQIVVSFKGQLDRIERNQHILRMGLIDAGFKIPDMENENAEGPGRIENGGGHAGNGKAS